MMTCAPKVPADSDAMAMGQHNPLPHGWEDRVTRDGRPISIRGANGVPDAQASGFFVPNFERFHLEVVPQ